MLFEKFKILQESSLEIALLVILKFLLDYLYIYYVNALWSYSGFLYEFSMLKYSMGWVVFLLSIILLYNKKELKIFDMYFFILLLYLLPNIIYFSLSNQDVISFSILILPWFAMLLLTINIEFAFTIPSINIQRLLVFSSFFILLSVLFHYMIATKGNYVVSFLDVYDFREMYGAKSSHGIFGYLNSWASKIFAVFLFAYYLDKKNYVMILLLICLISLLFIFSGNKIVLMGIAIVPIFYIYFKISYRRVVLLIGFISILIVSYIMYLNVPYSMLPSLLIRRALFVPAHLNFVFIDFFSVNDFVYWSNGVLKSLDYHPYLKDPVYIIGDYLSQPNMSANTGFIASGFMHAGYVGIVLYTFIGVIVFNIINYSINKNNFIVYSIVFLSIHTMFISSDLLTTILTHGLFVAILMVFFLGLNNKRTI